MPRLETRDIVVLGVPRDTVRRSVTFIIHKYLFIILSVLSYLFMFPYLSYSLTPFADILILI